MIALRGDAVEVFHQRVGQLLHFWKSLPPQGLEPPEQESGDAHAGLIRPEMIEFLSEHLRLEQPMIRAKDGAQFLAFRHAHHLPPPEQQPALAAAEPTHHGARPKELLPADFVEGCGRLLQTMQFVEHDGRLGQNACHGVQIGTMHVRADGLDRCTLPRIQVCRQQAGQALLRSVGGQAHHLAVDEIRDYGMKLLPFATVDSSAPKCRGRRFGRVWSHAARNARSARRALLQLTPCRTAAWLVGID